MQHKSTTIARTSNCRIDRCSCGAVHISVGGTTIRVKDGVARELRDILALAMREIDNQAQAAPAPPAFHLVRSLGDDDGDPELH
ncbi:hypothetical protein ENSA5_08730 [Enhygromyxa salina]|uniref:Uncharacterized protein n=1 Tax=Enhygromyxa salina TaxID=215803 RepID=A0A2S9YGS2_9BACT|nr:hypothetical protein [Enhygromyxa salina]PRQ04307.1 hypothetical protein ENSA5_08730 [Enhygromyxa salina]